ncbi:MAG: YgiQ family radical SAM protein [Desulfovibrionaceae bacterium]|nr:YgiQ family radical SAM protein [Desulfovibrionaceae bacterium]
MTRAEMTACGWDELDILLLSGDAYVDHPSFAQALLGRFLVSQGFRVGVLAQPNWRDPESIKGMGRPRLFCGIGSGAVDSMLANYTAFRQKRKSDAYAPAGRMGLRPNRATIVYANLARQAFPNLPIVLGGIEASTRRLTHYDFWSDSLRKPILLDAKADVLVYGMGERAILAIAKALAKGDRIKGLAGTAWVTSARDVLARDWSKEYGTVAQIIFPSHEELLKNKDCLLNQAQLLESQIHKHAVGYEIVGERAVVLAPPALPLTTSELDELYTLPFRRLAHPSYQEPIPAADMIKTSLTSHRGCGGGCAFCSLAMHQGRHISSRSMESIVAEATYLAQNFASKRRGGGVAISDVGGPTANMWMGVCQRKDPTKCARVSCCYPKVCPHFYVPQNEHIKLLRRIAAISGVKQVRVASGIRADLSLQDVESLKIYVREFTGGQLKLAPEHCVPHILELMRKPPLQIFEDFLAVFTSETKKIGRKQYIVPYLLSSYPGSTDDDMRELRDWLAKRHWSPKQVQCFIPTPGTVATAMYYCEKNERGEKIYVAKTDAARLRQHRILLAEMR